MKMRKRIAALIAVAMIAALMPMTTFAASDNRVTKTVKVGEDQKLKGNAAPDLVIKLKDNFTSNQSFYLDLENAEWLKDEMTEDLVAGLKLDAGDTTLKVTVVESMVVGDPDIIIPLYTKVLKGEASVIVDPEGTVVSKGKYVFAVSDSTKSKVTVGDAPVIVSTGEIAKITIEEPFEGAILKDFGDNNPAIIRLELDDPDFNFTKAPDAEGKRGFSGKDFKAEIKKDGQEVEITVKKDQVSIQRGIIEIAGIEITASRRAIEGDVELYIDAPFIDNKTLIVAKYGDYGTKLTTGDVDEYTAGSKKTLKFKLEEIGKTAIVPQRSADFILSKDIEILSVKVNGKDDNNSVIDKDDKNEFTIPSFTGNSKVDDGKVEFEVEVNIPAKFSGDLIVEAEGRALVESSELKLAEVKARVEVKVEPIKVAVGEKSNQGGKITLTETEKGMIRRGKLVIQLPKDLIKDGVTFTNVGDLDLKTTGGIKVDDASLNDKTDAIEIQVRRQSTEAGSIEISGFDVKSRRIIADGAYEVEVGGDALSEIAKLEVVTKDDDGDAIDPKYKKLDAVAEVDFVLVGDKLSKPEVKFIIGSDKFLVDDKEMTMDAAAYIKDGRTMVPLRYLSYAIGIDEQAIKFSAGIVTIIDGTRIIQLENGSKNLLANGMTIPMSAAAEIIDGRTYVPVAEIGAVFNVVGTWDAAAQTATFK